MREQVTTYSKNGLFQFCDIQGNIGLSLEIKNLGESRYAGEQDNDYNCLPRCRAVYAAAKKRPFFGGWKEANPKHSGELNEAAEVYDKMENDFLLSPTARNRFLNVSGNGGLAYHISRRVLLYISIKDF